MNRHVFTSESVTEGHPDKMCDQISDAVLDDILSKDPSARVACETITTTGMIFVMGEITTDCYTDIPAIARRTVRRIGYDNPQFGFDCN
ncbi:MAG: S-adenosylmethionine synthetase N-terminal domain-containing protein, partial [Oscillospiraceae bacterium]